MGMIETLGFQRGNCLSGPCLYFGNMNMHLVRGSAQQILACYSELVAPAYRDKVLKSKRVFESAKAIADQMVSQKGAWLTQISSGHLVDMLSQEEKQVEQQKQQEIAKAKAAQQAKQQEIARAQATEQAKQQEKLQAKRAEQARHWEMVKAKGQEIARAQAAEQARQQEIARAQAAEQARQQEIARAQAAEQAKQQELARAQAAEQERQQELAKAQAAEQARQQEIARAQAEEQARQQELAKAQANIDESNLKAEEVLVLAQPLSQSRHTLFPAVVSISQTPVSNEQVVAAGEKSLAELIESVKALNTNNPEIDVFSDEADTSTSSPWEMVEIAPSPAPR